MKTFKNYVYIPEHGVGNVAQYRADADNRALYERGLTINDVTYEDHGRVLNTPEYLTVFTVKRFLWLRRLFRGIF